MAKAGGGSVNPASGNGSIPAFSMERRLIRGATLTYIDHATGEKIILDDLDVELRLPDFAGRGDLSLSARMNGQAVSLNADVAAFGRLLNGGVSQMAATVQAGGSKITLDGKAGISPLAADGVLNADIADMAALFGAVGVGAPDLPKGMGRTIAVSGKITYTAEGTAHLRNGKIKLDQNVFSGEADLFLTGDRPRLNASFTADALDFSVLAASVDGTGENVAVAEGWSKDIIDVSGLGALDARVSLAAGSVDLGTVKLGATAVVATLERSRMVFDLSRAQSYDGEVTGQFVMNGRGGLSVGGDLTATGLAMTPLLRDLADYERLVGTGDMRLKFLGVGNSVNAIMNS
ncbi:MAG: AsmA family protein, partial [Marinosulfonomonas sp.]|nr:AsmA family protein [Marinosulfonomonas sp.]